MSLLARAVDLVGDDLSGQRPTTTRLLEHTDWELQFFIIRSILGWGHADSTAGTSKSPTSALAVIRFLQPVYTHLLSHIISVIHFHSHSISAHTAWTVDHLPSTPTQDQGPPLTTTADQQKKLPDPTLLYTVTLTFDLQHLQPIACDVMKLLSNFKI